MAAEPTAPAPPWIRTSCPGRNWAISIKAVHAAWQGVGMAAAVAKLSELGLRAACEAATATNWA